MKICICKKDGSLWRPSVPPEYSLREAFFEMLQFKMSFYFQRVEWVPGSWFRKGKWVDIPGTWEPVRGEFDVVDEKEARIRRFFYGDGGSLCTNLPIAGVTVPANVEDYASYFLIGESMTLGCARHIAKSFGGELHDNK